MVRREDDRDGAKGETDEGGGRRRKERVLHTRVPAVLEEELKRLATALKMPVSNLVRAILEDAVDAVDAVGRKAEGELHGIADRLARQRDLLRSAARGASARTREAPAGHAEQAPRCPDAPGELLEGVIGFEPLVLATNARCSGCGAELPRGSRACRGVREEPGPRVLLGPKCKLLPGSHDEEEKP